MQLIGLREMAGLTWQNKASAAALIIGWILLNGIIPSYHGHLAQAVLGKAFVTSVFIRTSWFLVAALFVNTTNIVVWLRVKGIVGGVYLVSALLNLCSFYFLGYVGFVPLILLAPHFYVTFKNFGWI